MSEWKNFRKKNYGKNICAMYGKGVIDFAPESMENITNGNFKSYDEYLVVQRDSCGKNRRYFEMCYYHIGGAYADFKGKILRFDETKGKVLFKRIMLNGMYGDGTGFYGKEDHVWMDKADFEELSVNDCVQFEADIYRYMRKKDGKLIDYGLQNPKEIRKIESYEVPTDEELIDQQLNQLVCETCRYQEQCYLGMCIANKQEREARFQLLKNFQPGKFTPFTVLLAYELEYRMFLQTGGITLSEKDPNFKIMKKLISICKSYPVYYMGDVKEAFAKMTLPEKARIYIE